MIQKTITVDFSNDYVMPSIKATQGDALSRVYHLKLVNGGLAVDLTGCTVRALILPLGATTPLYEDLTVTAEATGKVDYTMSGNACAVAGIGLLVIEILETGTPDPLSVLNSKECKLEITAKRDFTGVIEASTAFNTLQSALAQIGQIGTLASLLTTAKTSLVAAINELFTSKMNLAGGSANPFTAMPYLGTAPIIESGAGYAKYADGTMVCYGKKTFAGVPITTVWGGLFYSAASTAVFDAFPINFIAVPVVVPFIGHAGTTGSCFVMSDIANMPSVSSPGGICAVRGTTGTIAIAAEYIAIGRWKA